VALLRLLTVSNLSGRAHSIYSLYELGQISAYPTSRSYATILLGIIRQALPIITRITRYKSMIMRHRVTSIVWRLLCIGFLGVQLLQLFVRRDQNLPANELTSSLSALQSVTQRLETLRHLSSQTQRNAAFVDEASRPPARSTANAGRSTDKCDANDHCTHYDYDPRGNVIGMIDPLGNSMSYTYDLQDHLTVITNPRGFTTNYRYDERGNVIEVIDALGNTTHNKYDPMNRLIATVDHLGNDITYSYDEHGNLVELRDRNEQVVRNEYDSENRLTATVDSNNRTIRLTYDKNGHVASITDSKGQTLRYEYNPLGQMIRSIDPHSRTTIYTYDKTNNLTEMVDNFGKRIRFNYDMAGNLLSEIETPDITGYSYDSRRRLLGERNLLDQRTTYSYDAAGNLTQVSNADGSTQRYSYDALGRRTSVTGSVLWLAVTGHTGGWGIHYAYTKEDLLKRDTKASLSGGTTGSITLEMLLDLLKRAKQRLLTCIESLPPSFRGVVGKSTPAPSLLSVIVLSMLAGLAARIARMRVVATMFTARLRRRKVRHVRFYHPQCCRPRSLNRSPEGRMLLCGLSTREHAMALSPY
jgi:YD repeat-containing protein